MYVVPRPPIRLTIPFGTYHAFRCYKSHMFESRFYLIGSTAPQCVPDLDF